MAKKQSTIYLSDDIYSYLIAYKDNNNLNNLSTAIERIILERIFSERGNLNSSVNTVKKKDEKKKDIPKTILDLKNRFKSIIISLLENKVQVSFSNKKESLFDSIFKKERKVKMYKYRVILENDTYEEIAKEYNINLFKLKEINNNITLSLGNIIKIPCKK